MATKKSKTSCKVLPFPKQPNDYDLESESYSPEEIAELTRKLHTTGLMDFFQTQVIPLYKAATDASDAEKQHKDLAALATALHVLRAAIQKLLVSWETESESVTEACARIVALASLSSRLMACATALYDTMIVLPDEPGAQPTPPAGELFLEGLKLHNRIIGEVDSMLLPPKKGS